MTVNEMMLCVSRDLLESPLERWLPPCDSVFAVAEGLRQLHVQTMCGSRVVFSVKRRKYHASYEEGSHLKLGFFGGPSLILQKGYRLDG